MCYNCTFNILSYTFSKQTIHVKIMIPGHILFTSQSLLYLHIDFYSLLTWYKENTIFINNKDKITNHIFMFFE